MSHGRRLPDSPPLMHSSPRFDAVPIGSPIHSKWLQESLWTVSSTNRTIRVGRGCCTFTEMRRAASLTPFKHMSALSSALIGDSRRGRIGATGARRVSRPKIVFAPTPYEWWNGCLNVGGSHPLSFDCMDSPLARRPRLMWEWSCRSAIRRQLEPCSSQQGFVRIRGFGRFCTTCRVKHGDATRCPILIVHGLLDSIHAHAAALEDYSALHKTDSEFLLFRAGHDVVILPQAARRVREFIEHPEARQNSLPQNSP